MSKATDKPRIPQSVRHKRVLDLAESRPDASLKDIAGEIPWATVDLVENVLEKYGDPAAPDDADQPSSSHDGGESNSPTDAPEPSIAEKANGSPGADQTEDAHASGAVNGSSENRVTDLSDKQRETLRVIADNPKMTQRELADVLDICAATVSTRVNAIDGFDWEDRKTFVEQLPDDALANHEIMATEHSTSTSQLEALHERVTDLEKQIGSSSTNQRSVFEDVELTHKVIHACMESDLLTEEDELQVLRRIIR